MLCKHCGTRFTQTILVETVFTRDPETMQEQELTLTAFLAIAAAHLGRVLHPKMRGRLDA